MNKLFYFLAILAFSAFMISCDPEEVIDPETNEKIELTGDLATQTLTKDKKYLLKGQVFVRTGQVLTIEAGTVIYGDKATRGTLIIDRGGKIIAEGTKTAPIVFTSNLDAGVRDRGDWGGLIILGKANVNQPNPAIEGITPETNFGTTNSTEFDNDNSGILKYVRVEFAGIELTPNNETNSITMGGVGRGTIMEYCQVSYGGDDGYEWFGGTINAKYLVSFAMWDDDFDIDYGWSGNAQFGLAIRYPGFADQSQSNGFECDNGPNDNDVQPYTTGTISNFTVLGPIVTGSTTSNANYGHGIDLRRRTSISITNTYVGGFPRGIRMNQASVVSNYQNSRGILFNNVMGAPSEATAYLAGTGVVAADVKALWEANNSAVLAAFSTDYYNGLGIDPALLFDKKLPDQYPSNPDFKLKTGGTLAAGAKFNNPKFSEANRAGFFQNVAFIGAFGAEDWTDGWAEFNPINKVY